MMPEMLIHPNAVRAPHRYAPLAALHTLLHFSQDPQVLGFMSRHNVHGDLFRYAQLSSAASQGAHDPLRNVKIQFVPPPIFDLGAALKQEAKQGKKTAFRPASVAKGTSAAGRQATPSNDDLAALEAHGLLKRVRANVARLKPANSLISLFVDDDDEGYLYKMSLTMGGNTKELDGPPAKGEPSKPKPKPPAPVAKAAPSPSPK